MIVIKPIVVDDAKLTSSNVPENDYPAYSSTATYNTGDRVMVVGAGVHRNYECLADGVSGTYPPDDPTKWLDLGPTNRWAMFDTKVGTKTANEDSIAVTIAPGELVNGLALFGVTANSVTVTMTDPTEGQVYSRTESLVYTGVNSWYDWFFAPFSRIDAIAFTDLPPYPDASLTVSIDYQAGVAECGVLTLGAQLYIGDAQYGAKLGIQDYSRKDVDTFGNWTVIERGFGYTAEFDVAVPTSMVFDVRKKLADLRAKPAAYIGSSEFPETHVFGFYRDFQINLSSPLLSMVTISVEGLT